METVQITLELTTEEADHLFGVCHFAAGELDLIREDLEKNDAPTITVEDCKQHIEIAEKLMAIVDPEYATHRYEDYGETKYLKHLETNATATRKPAKQ